MKFEVSQKTPDQISSDILLIYAFQNEKEKHEFVADSNFSQVNTALHDQLLAACKLENFNAEKDTFVSLFTQGKIVPAKVIVLGLGKKSEFVLQDLRETTGQFIRSIGKKVKVLSLSLPDFIDEDLEKITDSVVQSVDLAIYSFGKYKTEKDDHNMLTTVILQTGKKEKIPLLNKEIAHAQLYTQATVLARDLVNEQPFIATPNYLADIAQNIARSDSHLSCKIFGKTELEKMGMNAFLGIARAASTDPKFIFLEYTPPKVVTKRKLALIGKGITFDSGGINVKPGDHMQDMKMDMAGAACVLGAFSVIAQIKPNFPVIGLIAATPNLVSGTSIVPGDVVKALNGKTIEILNTDAEGRVTMADSLVYAVKQGATEILDFATLTGACLVALGTQIAGIFSNNRESIERVKSAAFSEGEKVWELPLEKEYKKLNKSEVADIANIPSSRYGGTITAALFLQEFVGDIPWVHFDIAGPAFADKAYSLGPKGGTGFGVRTVLRLLEKV